MYFRNIEAPENDWASESNLELVKSNFKWVDLASRINILEQRGVFESSEKMVPIKNNEPQPLLTFSFMDWFETHDFTEYQLIEFGSGNSTHYFAKYCKIVYSYEQNLNWYNSIKNTLPENVKYHLVQKWDPLPKIEHQQLNITLVDFAGIRYKAVKQLVEEDQSAIIILDNSDTAPNSSKLLLDNGYKEITFWGGKLTEHYESCTSIFFKDARFLPTRNFKKRLPTVRNVISNLYDKP